MAAPDWTQRWAQPTGLAQDVELAPLAAALEAQSVVDAVWLASSVKTTPGGDEHADLAIAFVLDDPSGAAERPEIIMLIEQLDPIASQLGLEVKTWAVVGPATVESEIAVCGRQIFESAPASS
jgi:hypothetical protein